MAVLPGADLTYKILGLAVTPAALGDWGKYVKALSDRNIPVNAVVTNITFDHTASFPKLQFAYNRFLTPAEYAQAVKRADGDDVKLIVAPIRTAPVVPALAAPLPIQPTIPPIAPPVTPTGPAPFTPPAPTPAPTLAPVGFGAAVPASVAAPAPPAETPKRTRRTREQIAAEAAAKTPAPAATVDLNYLPPAIQAAISAVGGPGSPAGQALLAQFPRPQATAPVATVEGPAVTDPPAVTPPVAVAPTGFGTAAPIATPQAPAAGVTASAMSLKALLEKKLGINQPAAPQ